MDLIPDIESNNNIISFVIFFLILFLLGIFLVIGVYFQNHFGKRSSSTKFSSKRFKKMAEDAGLTEEETRTLLELFRQQRIPRPLNFFSRLSFAKSVLRQLFRWSYTGGVLSEDERVALHRIIFSVEQKLENYMRANTFPISTRHFTRGMRFLIQVESKSGFCFKGLGKMHGKRRSRGLEVQVLSKGFGTMEKKQTVELVVRDKGSRGIYRTYVKGYISERNKRYIHLLLKHAKLAKIEFGERKAIRKNLKVAVTMITLLEENGRFVPAGDPVKSLLHNISINGCGIVTYELFPVGAVVQLNYLNPYDNERVRIIAEVIICERLNHPEVDAVMVKAKFLSMSDHCRNLIGTYVYEYEKELDKLKEARNKKREKHLSFDENLLSSL